MSTELVNDSVMELHGYSGVHIECSRDCNVTVQTRYSVRTSYRRQMVMSHVDDAENFFSKSAGTPMGAVRSCCGDILSRLWTLRALYP